MRLISNPSHKHSFELIREFNKHKDSISFKDHTQYSLGLAETTIKTVIECKKLGLSNKHMLWLTKQIYENQLTEDVIREDYFPIIKFHFNNQELLKPIESYSNISKLNTDIESLGGERETVSEKDLDIFFEKDGWILSMPHTTKASCILGKDTDWCTARTRSQNLFLHYVGNCSINRILFYLIKIEGNPKKNPNDKLSVGFLGEKPVFDGKFGGITVNSSNDGLTIEKFGKILGKELAQEMLIKMDEKCQSIKGKHPARKEMERIARSVDKYNKKIMELKNKVLINEFKATLANYYELSNDMEAFLMKDECIQPYLASNENLSESAQLILADSKDTHTKQNLAHRLKLEPAQLKLVYDEDDDVRVNLAENINVFKSVQLILSNDKKEFVRKYLAANPNLIEQLQLKLANDRRVIVRLYLAENRNLTESVQMKLANDKNKNVREALEKNPNLSNSAKDELIKSKNKR